MSHFQRLDPLTLPLQGCGLIEASAGTGKTFTIAALYLRLVLGHGCPRPLLPPEILVVTFTEAATQELRERIRERLTQAAQWFRGQGEADPLLQALRADYPEAEWPSAAHRLSLAAEWMDEAAIHTIHGWCNRMLTQHAFDSGNAFGMTLQGEDRALLEQVAKDYWRRFFYPLPAPLLAALGAVVRDPQTLTAKLRDLLKLKESQILLEGIPVTPVSPLLLADRWSDWYAQDQQQAQLARNAWLADADTLRQWFEATDAAGQFNRTRVRNALADLAALQAWAAGAELDPKLRQRYAQSTLHEKLKKGVAPLPHPAFAALESWEQWQQQEPSLKPMEAHLAQWGAERLALEQQRRAQMSFDDLITRLDTALQGPMGVGLATVIRQQYPVALIDEFQDTDAQQYRIFRSLYADQPELGLLMIGDPKQAIYAFRGADIHVYLQARRDTQGAHYTLDRNFRSTTAMVEAVNALFSRIPDDPGPFLLGDEVPFVPVAAQGRKEVLRVGPQPLAALQYWQLPDRSDKGLTEVEYRRDSAECCARQVAHLLTLGAQGAAGFDSDDGWRALRPADMAILVRTGKEASAVREALTRHGVRSVYLSDRRSVYATDEAKDLQRWLQALAHPEDARALRAALATPTLGWPWALLERLNQDEQFWESTLQQFHELRQVWRQQGVLPMLHRWLHQSELPARLARRDGGERSLTNLLHLAELLQQAAQQLDGEWALIRYLSEAIEQVALHDGSSDEHTVRLESDEALVKVVTIHKSKGLEYPLVFVPMVCSPPIAARAPWRYHDAEGALCLELGEQDQAKAAVAQEALQEEIRLLYVALTRAQHACWLGLGAAPKWQERALAHLLGQPASLPAAIDALGCWVEAAAAPEEVHYQAQETQYQWLPACEAAAPVSAPWWIASYSALKHELTDWSGRAEEQEPDSALAATLRESAEAESPERSVGGVEWSAQAAGIHQFPRGAGPGTFLHALLEWAAEQGFAHALTQEAALRDWLQPRLRVRGWQAWEETLVAWLLQLLQSPLPLADGESLRLCDLSPRSALAEMEFWLAVDRVDVLALDRLVCQHTQSAAARPRLMPNQLNGMLKGYIDLVVEHQGRYYVVDYKSNALGPTDADYSAAAMRDEVLAKRYELQYVLYTLALHRLLRSRLPDYDYDRHCGGALYLFLRGIAGPAAGVHAERPARALIEALDRLFCQQEVFDHG